MDEVVRSRDRDPLITYGDTNFPLSSQQLQWYISYPSMAHNTHKSKFVGISKKCAKYMEYFIKHIPK